MEFNEKFKIYSNTDLLRVIENPNDYQSQAVETAKAIFSDRQLSEMEIKIAKDELETERHEKSKKEQHKKSVENKVKNVGKSIFDHINPIPKKTPTSERTIRIISILFSGFFIFHLYKEFEMIKFMFTNNYAEWDFSMVLYFLPLIVIPTGTILFYMRKKTGWLLLTIFLTYSSILAIGTLVLTIKMYPSGSTAIFPQVSPLTIGLGFLFLSGIIWTISRENIRLIYSVSKQTMILTVAITALIVGIGIAFV